MVGISHVSYGCNLVYQLWTHAHLYEGKGKFAEQAKASMRYPHKPNSKFYRFHAHRPDRSTPGASEAGHGGQNGVMSPDEVLNVNGEQYQDGMMDSPVTPGGPNRLQVPEINMNDPEESLEVVHLENEEEETPQLSVWACAILLVSVTVLVAVTAEFLVGSINGLVASTPLSEEWVSLHRY